MLLVAAALGTNYLINYLLTAQLVYNEFTGRLVDHSLASET